MAPLLGAESTSFTLDNMGRFLCNTLQEALDSAAQTVAGRRRDFDVIVIGGGTFGAVVAEHLFITDTTRSRRILVLEAGPFVLPEHVQNMPFLGGAPDLRVPWVNHPALNYSGLIFAIGGRSLTWGGWSPELLDVEMAAWPPATRGAASPPPARYFAEASRQIGVKETNDFIYGPLHTALRKQLHAGLKAAGQRDRLHLRRSPRSSGRALPRSRGTAARPPRCCATGSACRRPTRRPRPSCANCSSSKRRSRCSPPRCRAFSRRTSSAPSRPRSVPRGSPATRPTASGPAADARKRLMIVPNCHVQELITETQPDNWVRVTGVRVWQNGGSVDIPLAPPRNGGQSAVVIALGTVETTRLALTTFQQSLAGRAAQRMGTNLIAHLRSNLTIRVPRAAIAANLPPTAIPSLQCSALLVKGKAPNGRTFHFQITAAGLQKLGTDSEAELFKKIPTLEHLQRHAARDRRHRRHHHPRHRRHDAAQSRQLRRSLDARRPTSTGPRPLSTSATPRPARRNFPAAPQTQNDRATWDAMDAVVRQDRADLRRRTSRSTSSPVPTAPSRCPPARTRSAWRRSPRSRIGATTSARRITTPARCAWATTSPTP